MSEADNKSKVWNALSDTELDNLSAHRINAATVGFILDEIIDHQLNEEYENATQQ